MAISKPNKGKAADIDGLSAEHLIYAHPSLTAKITKLFELMLHSGSVPDGFGRGLTFPVPKSNRNAHSTSADEYRAITICPIISKVFEHCILFKVEDFLNTSSRQFGFKRFTSCMHANYILKETVDYTTLI